MSSINNNFLTNKINSATSGLTNAQNALESAQGNLFDLNQIIAGGDSFVSTTSGADTSVFAASSLSSVNNQTDTTTKAKEYETEISKLEKQIQQYEAQIETLNAKLEAKESYLEIINQKVATTEKELENLENQKAAKEEQYSSILAQIDQAESNNKNGEQDMTITNLNSRLNTVSTEINILETNISTKSEQLGTYRTQASDTQAEIFDKEDKISNIETLKTTAELQKTNTETKLNEVKETIAATATGAAKGTFATTKLATDNAKTDTKVTNTEELMSLLPDQENDFIQDLIDKGCLDLSEKLDDGSPRYIFAQAEDGKYHVYDMNPDIQEPDCGVNWAPSVVRRELGYSDESDCMIPMGSGYISFDTEAKQFEQYNIFSTHGQKNVYYVDDCDEVKYVEDCYATCSPLSFDLNGDGVKTSDELIQYDIDGDGKLDTINDSADAILVFDADGDGISGEDGSECFGDNTDLDGDGVADGYKDGFEALKALANKEGLINGIDDNTLDENDLKILEEKYGLQIKTDGYNSEASSLFDAGITEINLATTDETTLHKNYDSKSNDLMTQEGATFVVNGEEREYADIWHAKKDE